MKKIGLLVSIMVFGFIAMADDYDKEIISWSDSLMSHCDPTCVWIGNETVYLENVTLPYVYACGAVLHKTAGGYRLDLPGIEISDLCIQANGDLAVFVTGENVVRVNSNRGDFTVEREGMFYSGLYAHNLFVFGPGKLTIVGDVDSKLYGTSGILCDRFFGDVKIGAGTTVDFQNLARGIYCQALDIVLARLRFAGVENGIEAHSVFLNASCVVGTCTGKGIFANNFIHVYQSIVDLQCSDNCFESGETIIFEAIVTLLSWNRNGIWSQGNIVMEDSEFSAYAGPKYCGVGTAQSLGIGDGRYRIVTGSEGAGIRGGYVVLSGGDVEVCSPNGVGCYLYSGMYEAASNSVYSGSFKTINRIDIEDLLTINLESAAFYGVSSALLSSDFYEFFADVGGKLLMSGVSTLATSVKYGRPKYGILKPYDVSGLWVTADSGYVEMFDGTVLVDNAEIGVQVPLLSICGGSFNGSYSLYNNLKPIAVLMEDGQVVVKSLKCVKERFPDADSGSKIVSGWRTQLPPYYMTQSLYLDDDRSLYFWIPEDTEGEGSVMITFDPRGGDLSEGSRTVKKGSAVGTLPTPTRNKYKFNGWYTATTGGTKISATTKVDVDVTYYAQWTYVGSEADYPTCDLPTAFDNSKLTFTTGGNADWFGQGGVTHDGTDAARSGIIMHNQNSWMQTTVTGPGTFSFWWYASSEVNGGNWNDYLTFLIDGVQVDKIGGTSCSWTHCSYTLGAGSHTLKWNYLKNGSQDVGEDAGFVDQIVWEPVTTYTVSFNANGGAGTMANQTFTYGVSTVLKPNAFTKNGYTFAGWSKTAGGSVVYDDGALVSNLVSPGGSITLYAVWTAVSSDFEIVNGMLTGYNGTGGAVTIPSGVTSIGDYVFRSCDGLTSVTIPEGVTSIGGDAFSYCSMLKSVTIPSSMMRIGNWAFDGCSSLASITIPEGVICIGEGAFYRCGGLRTMIIPQAVTNIGYEAFRYCGGLTEVELPAGLTNIAGAVFCQCSALKSVTLPESLMEIGEEAFSGCGGLTELTIPSKVVQIGSFAFYECDGLSGELTIPSNVSYIGMYAFTFCTGIESLKITDGVQYIDDSAFADCENMISVSIPASVSVIGSGAFAGCTLLDGVQLPEGLDIVDDRLFERCSSLTSIRIPEGVTRIGWSAFEDCSGLKTVVIPSSVTSIGSRAFFGCPQLGRGLVVVDGCLLVQNGTCPERVEIPQGIRLLADRVFANCGQLIEVLIPEGLPKISEGAFAYCSGLAEVSIPSGVKVIEDDSFMKCTGLKSVVISEGVSEIGFCAFGYCSSLIDVTVSGSVTNIGGSAFVKCEKLASATFFGAPPVGLEGAEIGKAVRVRYNREYETEWLVAIDRCGFTNATPIDFVDAEGSIEGIPAEDVDAAMLDYPELVSLAGGDRARFLLLPSAGGRKVDAAGKPMTVWQDILAGTDPNDPNDKFTIKSVEVVNGEIKLTWEPDLNQGGTKHVRKYTEWGCESLGSDGWVDMATVPDALKCDYKFRKVTVDMP